MRLTHVALFSFVLATSLGCTAAQRAGSARTTYEDFDVGAGSSALECSLEAQAEVDTSAKQTTGRTVPPVRIACNAPRRQCGSMCVDVQTDVNHCGACLNRCPTGASCTGGACACPADRPVVCEGGSACLPRLREGDRCECQAQCPQERSMFCHGTCQRIE